VALSPCIRVSKFNAAGFRVMSLSQLMTAAFETAFNQYLSLDPETLSKFSDMEGKIIAVDIQGINQSLYLFPGEDGMMIMSDFDGEADTRLAGSPMALAKLGTLKNAAPVLFSGEVIVSGDTRLGSQFKKILSQIDIDWEEILSQYTGDMVAHKAGNMAREFTSWFQRGKQSMYMDVGEYLTEESLVSPSKPELNRFINDVDKLRESADRLQTKINNLLK
jgi:ubiquinone biosynthesis accessory factor UbiJ